MYYDRRIHDRLAHTLRPGEPLAWLMDHVRSAEGRARHAHIQFRRDDGNRPRGAVQLYWGRTSPLEFKLLANGRIKLHADNTYGALSDRLFSEPVAIDLLAARENDFRAHLERASRLLDESPPRRCALVRGEAACHAGLMRRYGHRWRSGDPLVAIDSEAQIGFDSVHQRRDVDAEIRTQLRLLDAESIPTKLDALGILPTGDIALVEVKDAAGSIDRALVQAAAHVLRYSRLLAEGGLARTLGAMIDQKAAATVIPLECPRPTATPRLVPCIAAPDESPDWPARWHRALRDRTPQLRAALADPAFIRLSEHGRILEFLTP